MTDFGLKELFFARHDLWHFHWPETVLNSSNSLIALAKTIAFLCLLSLTRIFGSRIVWTAHNLGSHEGYHPRLERWFWSQFTKRLNGVISTSHFGLEKAREAFPTIKGLPSFITPIGSYTEIYANECTQPEARDRLGIARSSLVLLSFGEIREYKNIPELIRVFRKWTQPNAILVIAGHPRTLDLEKQIRTEAAGDARIHLNLAHVADDDIQYFLNASDIMVIPFKNFLHASTALLGLTFHRPILVPRNGTMIELRRLVGDDRVLTYSNELSPEVFERALEVSKNTYGLWSMPNELDWDHIAKKTLKAYQQISKVR